MTQNDDNTQQEQQAKTPYAITLFSSIRHNALLLGLFALACTAFIAATFLGTEDEIAEQKRAAQLKALIEIVPNDRHNNDMLQDQLTVFDKLLGHRNQRSLFLARYNGKAVTLIYPVTARDGYSGDIDAIVGVNIADNSIAGVRVLSHKETPGLGDGIELRKSDWIKGFDGKDLNNPNVDKWTVKKDGGVFDGFTGATITPRAVVRSVASVLQYHEQNHAQLLQQFSDMHKDKDTE